MKRIWLSLIMLSTTIINLWGRDSISIAQPQPTNYTINAYAVDTAGQAVGYATFVLRAGMMDLEGVKRGVSTENGVIEFTYSSEPDTMILTLSKEGMTSTDIPVVFADKESIDLGKISLKAGEELKAVEIVAYKPLVTQDLDRLKYDVASDPSNLTNTTLEMLRKVPLITIDHEENIMVKGSSSYKIYINGKPSNIVSNNPKDVLKAMPASNIKSIEVITDPGAKYDAEGVTAIINIITKRALQGFQGNLSSSYDFSSGGARASAYFTAKIGKLGFSTNYNYSYYRQENYIQYMTEYKRDDFPYKFSGAEEYAEYGKSHSHNASVEISYEFDSLNLLNASFNFWKSRKKNSPYQINMFYQDKLHNTIGKYYHLMDMYNFSFANIDGSIDYQHTFRKDGQNLTLSYLISSAPQDQSQIYRILQDLELPAPDITEINISNLTKAYSTEHTFQIDYTEPFLDKKHTMEVGLKYILRNNIYDNAYMLFNPLTEAYDIKDPTQDEADMNYYQHIFGAYGSYTFRHKSFSLRVGARVEGNIQDIRFVEDEDKNFKAKYIDVVPSISFNYMLSQAMSLSLSYNNTIARPSIYYLNPYVDRQNAIYIQYGNPNLKSERSHNVSLLYSFFAPKVNLNMSVNGGLVNNAIMDKIFVDDNGIHNNTYENIGRNYSAGVSLFLKYNATKWMSMYLSANPSYSHFQTTGYEYGSIGCFANAGFDFNLPWKLKLSLGAGGQIPQTTYKQYFGGFYYYYADIERSFLKNDQLTLSLSLVNPHAKYEALQANRFDDSFSMNINQRQHMRQINIYVSWRFGDMKTKIAKTDKSIENSDLKDKSSGNNGL